MMSFPRLMRWFPVSFMPEGKFNIDMKKSDVVYPFMDFPDFMRVNPLLEWFVGFCLWACVIVRHVFDTLVWRGIRHCASGAENEQSSVWMRSLSGMRNPVNDGSFPLMSAENESSAWSKHISDRQTIRYFINPMIPCVFIGCKYKHIFFIRPIDTIKFLLNKHYFLRLLSDRLMRYLKDLLP